MLKEVIKCAESHDIKGLHYIFVDSLDVDPTFETYREDYEYCKKIDGMFEPHRDISPMLSERYWTPEYWNQLKLDLMKNFSEKRFEHMISVARIVYKDKISRLVAERNQRKEKALVNIPKNNVVENRAMSKIRQITPHEVENRAAEFSTINHEKNTKTRQEEKGQDKQRIEQRKKELDAYNEKIEEKQRVQKEKIEAAKRADSDKKNAPINGNKPKKVWRVALIIMAIVLVIILIIMVIKSCDPEETKESPLSPSSKVMVLGI